MLITKRTQRSKGITTSIRYYHQNENVRKKKKKTKNKNTEKNKYKGKKNVERLL